MLVDRKFFYPVAATAPTPPPVMGNAAGNPALSPDSYALVGAHRRRRRGHHGHQSGVYRRSFSPGKTRCEGASRIQAIRHRSSQRQELHRTDCPGWVCRYRGQDDADLGQESADRQTVTVGSLGAAFHKFPLRYTATADTDDATLEITGTGTGAFHVGAVSLMPADNIEGFRPEVIAALKQLRFGV